MAKQLNLVLYVLYRVAKLRRGREFLSLLNHKIGINLSLSRKITKIWKVIVFPVEWVTRKLAQKRLNQVNVDTFSLCDDIGWAVTSCDQLPWGRETLKICQNLVDSHIQHQATHDCDPSFVNAVTKSFRIDLLTRADLLSQQDLLRFATSPELVLPISHYLRTIPVIGHYELWLSYPNSTLESSQCWHFDHEDKRQVKLFCLINDVWPENGPTNFLSLNASRKLRASISNPYSRIIDSEVESLIGVLQEQSHQVTGQAGAITLLDTVRCAHMGARVRQGKRIMLMIQYVPFHCVLESNCHVLVDINSSNLTGGGWPEYVPHLLIDNPDKNILWRAKPGQNLIH